MANVFINPALHLFRPEILLGGDDRQNHFHSSSEVRLKTGKVAVQAPDLAGEGFLFVELFKNQIPRILSRRSPGTGGNFFEPSFLSIAQAEGDGLGRFLLRHSRLQPNIHKFNNLACCCKQHVNRYTTGFQEKSAYPFTNEVHRVWSWM